MDAGKLPSKECKCSRSCLSIQSSIGIVVEGQLLQYRIRNLRKSQISFNLDYSSALFSAFLAGTSSISKLYVCTDIVDFTELPNSFFFFAAARGAGDFFFFFFFWEIRVS